MVLRNRNQICPLFLNDAFSPDCPGHILMSLSGLVPWMSNDPAVVLTKTCSIGEMVGIIGKAVLKLTNILLTSLSSNIKPSYRLVCIIL